MLLAPAEDAHVFNVAVTEPMLGAPARALRWLRAGTVLAPLAANTWTRFGRFLCRAGDNGAATGALRRAAGQFRRPGAPWPNRGSARPRRYRRRPHLARPRHGAGSRQPGPSPAPVARRPGGRRPDRWA